MLVEFDDAMRYCLKRLAAALLLMSVFMAGCAPDGGIVKPDPRAASRVNEFIASQVFTLAAEPGKPLTVQAYVGGAGPGNAGGQDFFMITLAAPRVNNLARPPRHWAISLDTSAGMRGRSWKLALRAARKLLARLREQDRVILATFGGKNIIHGAWMAPRKAKIILDNLKPDFADVRDAQIHGMRHLAEGLVLTAARQNLTPTGFFISNLAGADQRLVATAGAIRRTGVRMHVLCVAGGNDELLLPLGREICGKAIFLSQQIHFDHQLYRYFFRNFDASLLNVNVMLWFDADEKLAKRTTSLPFTDDSAEAGGGFIGGRDSVFALPTVHHLGPGDSRVWLFRLAEWTPGVVPDIRIRVRGITADGSEFYQELLPERNYLRFLGRTSRGSGEERALYKAIVAVKHLDRIRMLEEKGMFYPRASFAAVMQQIKDYSKRLDLLNLSLSDADITRENRILKAVCKLNEDELIKLRRRNHGHALRASTLPEALRGHGLSYRIMQRLLFK